MRPVTTLLGWPRFVNTRSQPTLSRSMRQYTSTTPKQISNRVYEATVRTEEELESLILLSATSKTPLLTLWGAKWCPACKVVTPLVRELVRSGVGERQGGVSFAEVEVDAPTLGGMAMRYAINSMPTLLAFDRQEAQLETRVTKVDDLKSREFLVSWIEGEAGRHGTGGGGGGGSVISALFGR